MIDINKHSLMHRIYSGNTSNRMIMEDMAKDLWVNGYTAIVMTKGFQFMQESIN
jgi:hypothetical protein